MVMEVTRTFQAVDGAGVKLLEESEQELRNAGRARAEEILNCLDPLRARINAGEFQKSIVDVPTLLYTPKNRGEGPDLFLGSSNKYLLRVLVSPQLGDSASSHDAG